MYLDFYGFREKPFNLTPDPRFVFLSKNHREAFAHLLYGINNRAGFIALTGEVGAGKTTVLRALLGQLDADRHRTALIFNPKLSPPELMESINREFGLTGSSASGPLDELNTFLLRENAEGRTVVLVVDEAQNLEASVLEQIRLISNLETDREKLIQIVLAGQPELVQMLNRKELRQLSQRITVRYHLQPMDFQDTVEYIDHRLEVAGGSRATFSRMSLKRIYRYSGGLPRLINAACDRALLAGYTRDTPRITRRIACAGIKDLKKDTRPAGRWLILVPAVFVIVVLVAAGLYLRGRDVMDVFRGSIRVEATEKGNAIKPEQAEPSPSPSPLSELGTKTEMESARQAFNALAALWRFPPIEEKALADMKDLERLMADRKIRIYRFSGNLGALLRLDCPAVLDLNLPGIQGKRFIPLLGRKDEGLRVGPGAEEGRSLSFSELEKHWSGQALIPWKDPLNLLTKIKPGSKGEPIQRLQELLSEGGFYKGPATRVYDPKTVSAVKAFQLSKGMKQDGIAGAQTLMLLYRSIPRFSAPALTTGDK